MCTHYSKQSELIYRNQHKKTQYILENFSIKMYFYHIPTNDSWINILCARKCTTCFSRQTKLLNKSANVIWDMGLRASYEGTWKQQENPFSLSPLFKSKRWTYRLGHLLGFIYSWLTRGDRKDYNETSMSLDYYLNISSTKCKTTIDNNDYLITLHLHWWWCINTNQLKQQAKGCSWQPKWLMPSRGLSLN